MSSRAWVPGVHRWDRQELDSSLFQVVTSTLTLTVRNLKRYRLVQLSRSKLLSLRSRYSLRTPDAVQLATAIQSEAEYFLTNDKKLRRPERIRTITVEELPIHAAHP
ncbi:type II toxin-antitoxin system VapC family toxin [Nevskia soli]|uniref:type II toxin-antitoxin system VapC family toxin n=1 Tax=Nevskia soli TaxID=418856 RepID=UPI001C5CAEC1|nr:PIN domain-containing protein [Nevskia soli]